MTTAPLTTNSVRPTRAPDLDSFGYLGGRIALTISCTDTDELPRIPGAGDIDVVDGTEVQVMHNGVVIERDSYIGPWMTEIIRCLRGFHEPQEELVFARIIERIAATEDSPSIVELGCWWSFYSLWFRRVMPNSRVVGLEPDPHYLETAKRNLALNHESTDLVHGGIATGTAPTLEFLATSDGQMHEVPQYSLAQLLDMHHLDRTSLVLADIQGAETALIEQSKDLFTSGRVRFLIVSTHHHSISGDPTTHQRTVTSLQDLGAHVIAEHTVGESFSGDGLVAVSFDQRDEDFTIPISRARQRDSLFGEMEHELAATLARAASAEEAAATSAQTAYDLQRRVDLLEAELAEERTAQGPERKRPWSRKA